MSTWVWIYIIVVLIGAGVIIALDSHSPAANYDRYLDPFVLFATLVVIAIYTAQNIKLAKANQQLASISSAQYLEQKEPQINFLLGLDPSRKELTGDGFPMREDVIKANAFKKLQTPVSVTNRSTADAAVRVNLNCRIDGELYVVGGDDYSGKTWWNLQAGHSITTPGFSIEDALFQKTQRTIDDIKKEIAATGNQALRITLDIVLTYKPNLPRRIFKDKIDTPTFDYYLEKAPLKYHLNLKEERWVYVVDFTET